MEKQIFISLPKEELQTLMIDCFTACLKLYEPNTFNSLESDLLTITQAGEVINLTVPTIYSLVSKKMIPHNKKGKRLYFLKSELLDWVKSGRKKTIAECETNPESHLRTPKKRRVTA
jgi:excisionase family DNA binding protein